MKKRPYYPFLSQTLVRSSCLILGLTLGTAALARPAENRPSLLTTKRASLHAPDLHSASVGTVDISLSGTISDEQGAPLPGVSIVLKGTQRGTTSNAKGEFALMVPDQNSVLTFSFVGYMPQEIVVGNRTSFQVKMAPENKVLDEVIVVGYGTQKKSTLTGSRSEYATQWRAARCRLTGDPHTRHRHHWQRQPTGGGGWYYPE